MMTYQDHFDSLLHTSCTHLYAASQNRFHQACRYAMEGGGKRIRPQLVHGSFLACGGQHFGADLAALAVEWIHTYSLVHDDLPTLDNDAVRRGRPTVHVQFDEVTALLVGDALLSDAFSFFDPTRAAELRCTPIPPASVLLAMSTQLARSIGGQGMVLGQYWDMKAPEVALLEIHRYKTGALMEAACIMGGLAAGASPPLLTTLSQFGSAVGMWFQLQDDVLDGEADPQSLEWLGIYEKKVRETLLQLGPHTEVLSALVTRLTHRRL